MKKLLLIKELSNMNIRGRNVLNYILPIIIISLGQTSKHCKLRKYLILVRIIALNESWIQPDVELLPNDYQIFRKDRKLEYTGRMKCGGVFSLKKFD